ncbi:tyrosine decarboxylase MfnA [Streptomyces sp. CS090A]|uniref:tyrosine decarboxylase MfnA n=1 Tax=Streptomyces sp. CS090A TaxID=2162710 RepID=UPI000D50F663|nr:tyrosine decarboxylase MfnA [Streptomyces sp. CS090A]PVC89261.1 tyrosine decarboxylase MfnA [Streptomyces sp. CS090A]
MRPTGLPETAVREEIAAALAEDVPWPRVLNSICTEPHPVAVEAARAAAHTNLGDVRIFRGTKRIERKVVSLLLELLGRPQGAGSLVSGGTEANLLAVLAARREALRTGRLSDRPEVVVGSTVHFSFDKIFAALGVTSVRVPVDDGLRLAPESVEKALTEHTLAVVATAGSSELGVVDRVDDIAAVLEPHGVWLHVDAATGGFVIPFARELGLPLPQFDFSLDGVRSITIDPHKYGLANVPAGVVLFRDEEAHQADSFFHGTPAHTTFLGTRPGSAAVAVYAVLEHLGREGFVGITRTNYENTRHLTDRLADAGYGLIVRPELNIVVVRVPNAVEVSDLLDTRGWIVSTSKRFEDAVRIVVTRHVTRDVIDEFVPALIRADHDIRAGVTGR